MDKEIHILAQTIYGESNTPSISSAEAIANVILNRVKYAKNTGSHWWGNSVSDVCLKPRQFNCWDVNHQNHQRIKSIHSADVFFQVCHRIAVRAIKGLLTDNTHGATNYHSKDEHPKWAHAAVPCAEIGNNLFYATH